MLAHRTGMIGFPLRLLARENYDRIAALQGREAVALVTGEERIVPARPRYWVATVEAMPLDRRVDFLAVDEIQLAADRERGHVFTDRILNARGREETMLIGAETIRPLLRRLLPDAAFLSRPRLSTLTYAAPKKIGRLPRRSAVIVFSIPELYRVAERLRREQGGAALVFGALSPRTRNAQVGLYESGEVDLLVATDAIGMGLNLDIDCVIFTALDKHDGIGRRALTTAEVGQIAGRAGRHVKDGHFAPTLELGPLDERLVRAVEDHRFPPLESLYWRSSELDFASGAALLASLERRPPQAWLRRMAEADDHRALRALLADPAVAARGQGSDALRLLWDVCQVPDFQGTRSEGHRHLLAEAFRHLSGPARRLPESWVAGSVRDLDRVDGPLDLLLARLAGIRTWTYVSHRSGWLSDAAHWQERTRAVEDRLSDALHERLTEEYVDRPAAILLRYDPAELITVVTESGDVLVQGLRAGVLEGFRFRPDPSLRPGAKGLLAAANRSLRNAIRDRVAALAAEPDAGLRAAGLGRRRVAGGAGGAPGRGRERAPAVARSLRLGSARSAAAGAGAAPARGLGGSARSDPPGGAPRRPRRRPRGAGARPRLRPRRIVGHAAPARGRRPGGGALPRRPPRPGRPGGHAGPAERLHAGAAATRGPAAAGASLRGAPRGSDSGGARRNPFPAPRPRPALPVLRRVRLPGGGAAGGARGPSGSRGVARLTPVPRRPVRDASRGPEAAGHGLGRSGGGGRGPRLRRAWRSLHATPAEPPRRAPAPGLSGSGGSGWASTDRLRIGNAR